MITRTHDFALITALAGAAGYAAAAPAGGGNPVEARTRAGADIRHAQVELYCGHRADALAAIRRATHELEAMAERTDAMALASLGEAAWQTRRRQTDAAVAALDAAMTRLVT